jgi:threonyl-tRNA synthetase
VRGFTQDDAHIFCTPEQVKPEILNSLDFTRHLLGEFGFTEYRVYLSTKDPQHPEKYMGSEQEWSNAQNVLAEALQERDIAYQEVPGEAVFYGPKIDINIVDASRREWQCTTIQFDFNLSKGLVIFVSVCVVWLVIFSSLFCGVCSSMGICILDIFWGVGF